VTFTASATNRTSSSDAVDIPAVEKTSFGPNLIVTTTPGATSYSIAYSGDAVTLSIDGAAYGAPAASPIVVARNTYNGADKIYAFKAVLDSQTVTDTVVIPAIGAVDTNTVTPNLTVTPSAPATTTLSFTVTASNPSGGTAPTIAIHLVGCTASGYVDGDPVVSGVTVVVNRPAWDTTAQATVTFTATIASNGAESISRTVQNQARDTIPLLARAKVQSTSATQAVFRVAVADPIAQSALDVSLVYTVVGCSINTPASPQTIPSANVTTDIDTTGTVDVTIDRAAFGSGMGRVTFTASRSGRVAGTDSGDVASLDRILSADPVLPTESTARDRCSLYLAANQSIADNTSTSLLWDGELYDVGTLHDTVTNNNRITIPTGGNSGTWLFAANVAFAGPVSPTGARVVTIQDSAANVLGRVIVSPAPSTINTWINITAMVSAPSVGEWFECVVTQTQGASVDVLGGIRLSTFSAIHLW